LEIALPVVDPERRPSDDTDKHADAEKVAGMPTEGIACVVAQIASPVKTRQRRSRSRIPGT
jgi:hypothetical protein